MGRVIKGPKPNIGVSKSFNGLHEIQFNETSHRYKLDGEPMVGVTTFVKAAYPPAMNLISWMKGQTAEALFCSLTVPGDDGFYPREGFWPVTADTKKELIKEAKKAGKAIALEAADIGTICHGFAELHSIGKEKEAEQLLAKVRDVQAWPLIESCVSKYLEWTKTNRGELVMAEALVASPTFHFCGKFDRLDKVDGYLRLRDYKTSKGIYLEQFIQLAGYAIAIKEWLNLDVNELEVLRFGKDDGSFETLTTLQIADAAEMSNDEVMQELRLQAIRCRETYTFKKLENISCFERGGTSNDHSEKE